MAYIGAPARYTTSCLAAPVGKQSAQVHHQQRHQQDRSSLAGQLCQQRQLRRGAAKLPRGAVHVAAAAAAHFDHIESVVGRLAGPSLAPGLVTGMYILVWYGLHLAFQLQNKLLLNLFPYPWFIATVHVVIGSLYCAVLYACGAQKASFERPLTLQELRTILGPAAMHAAGHVASNLSFVAVALSLTHTVKALEPAFSAALSKLILGQNTPVPALLCLVPIMLGVAATSAAELSFNWMGLHMALLSNFAFALRAVLSKKAMGSIECLGSTGMYSWTTLISVLVCAPGIFIFERDVVAAMQLAAAKYGAGFFYGSLVSVGLLYHLYNQFAFNTLARVSAVSHGVCNVVNRVAVIVASVLYFGTELSTTAKVGTAVTLLGTLLYSEAVKRSSSGAKAQPGRVQLAVADGSRWRA